MDRTDRITDETQARLASIGQISAGIAHEIRNPLTAVKGFLQMMQKDISSRYWDIVNTELEQAISTVQNLLNVSKPAMDDETARPVELCALIEGTLSLFQNETYRIHFEKRFYNTNVKILGKSNLLKRALFNLLKNASEAIEGSGTITIEHSRRDNHVCLIIKDTGKGIPEDKLPMLGTPFFTTKAASGTGLGLAQVYSTFYEHGGTVSVQSEEGHGTQFTITIPVAAAEDIKEGGVTMNLVMNESMDIREFFEHNREEFNRQLENEANTTFEVVGKSKFVTKTDLIDHANQIVSLIHNGLTQEIIALAQDRGMAWAKSDVPIVTKLEWFYALRKVIWSFMRYYYVRIQISHSEVFELSERINDALDNFIVHFNVSFTKYRDDILRSREAIIDELTVPVIPIFKQIAVLPLIGTLDEARVRKIEDRLLDEVEARNIQKLFIDLSGAVISQADVVNSLVRIIDGIGLLGCKASLTGMNAKLVKLILNMDKSVMKRLVIESTLQQALAKESIGEAAE